ncbi:hypothetical protein Shyhy02_08390 [Streptomyces hygroscopicus subsp. hygroscopicus]|nr:hypothetical protein Shyhy02_08390 [Streptomyces hygroscopicus subsp. hygroscopicus]
MSRWTEPMDVLGPLAAQLPGSTDTAHADIADIPARLCGVGGPGRSVRVCDGPVRSPTTPGPLEITVPMSPTAHRPAAGTGLATPTAAGAAEWVHDLRNRLSAGQPATRGRPALRRAG